jgi:hypothetical protein
MSARAVANSYAEEHGLEFLAKGVLQFAAPTLGGTNRCVNAIRGAIGNGPSGILCQRVGASVGGTAGGIPSAQYEIAGLGDAIEGLWVRRSGRSLWNRVAVPRGHTELMLPSEALMARYRVAIASARDEAAARRLLSGDFVAWLVDGVPERGRLWVGATFELSKGVLFIRGPIDAYRNTEKLDAFAGAAARIATEVAALAGVPAPSNLVASHVWACAICGGAAGSIALNDSGEVRRECFTSVITTRLPDAATSELRAALAAGDAASLYDLDPELASWWCPECQKSYCGDHWVRWDVFDEDDPNWHDSIRGRCPDGHERMLED